jgi:hypothetical protein
MVGRRRVLGDDHPNVLGLMNDLATFRRELRNCSHS